MAMFYYLGRFVEPVLGGPRFLLLYVIGAYAAGIAEYLVTPNSPIPVIGASGAVSAVLGAYAIYFGERRAGEGDCFPPRLAPFLCLPRTGSGRQLLTECWWNVLQAGFTFGGLGRAW